MASKELRAAIDAAKAAGRLIERGFEGKRLATPKGSKSIGDFVTKTDIAAERLIIKRLRKRFPDYGVLAEESGADHKNTAARWIIDPLDGTHNFFFGVPIFGTSIALEKEGKIVLGVLYFPKVRELYYAEKGSGAYLNGRRMRVSTRKDTKSIMAIASSPWHYPEEPVSRYFSLLMKKFYRDIRILGCATYNQSLLAAGRVDAIFLDYQSPWDVAAGSLLIQEAGGKVTDMRGRPFNIYQKDYVATNGLLHSKILRLLR